MILVIVAIALVAALVAHLVLQRRFDAEIETAFASVGKVTPVAIDRTTLPPLVRAFAERNVAGRPDLPAAIRMTQAVEMKLAPERAPTQMEARQVSGIGAPAFAWDATARMAPLVGARVIDAYVGGEGWLKVRLLGSIPLATATGPDATFGELFRYLAELPWTPHAILGNPALRWREIDASTVEVSTEAPDGRIARVRLVFDDAGDIVAIEADDRPYQQDGVATKALWRGAFGDYRDYGGVRIPARGEVSWVLETGPFTYFRGEVVGYDLIDTGAQ